MQTAFRVYWGLRLRNSLILSVQHFAEALRRVDRRFIADVLNDTGEQACSLSIRLSLLSHFPNDCSRRHARTRAVDCRIFLTPFRTATNACGVGGMPFDGATDRAPADANLKWTFHLLGRCACYSEKGQNAITRGEMPLESVATFINLADIGLAANFGGKTGHYNGSVGPENDSVRLFPPADRSSIRIRRRRPFRQLTIRTGGPPLSRPDFEMRLDTPAA